MFLLGPLSDEVSRKRVLIPSLLVMALGLLTCLLANNVWVLMAGRVLQGLAVGAGTTTLAGGPLVAGSLAEFGPAPTALPYVAALAFVFVTLSIVARAPETVPTLKPFAPRPARIHIPTAITPALYLATGATVPALVVGFAAKALGFETATLSFVEVIAARCHRIYLDSREPRARTTRMKGPAL